MDGFPQRQAALTTALAANSAASTSPHVVIAMPSHSVGEALLSHYGKRVLSLEHRFLLSSLITHRLPHATLIFVSSLAPEPEVVEYYRHLGPHPDRYAAQANVVAVDDLSPRCMSAKLLERPELLARIREFVAHRPAVIEPWNVTHQELEVAAQLGVPINGTHPDLLPMGYKSQGRKVFRSAGVPLPEGVEDVRTVDDVMAAIGYVRLRRPRAPAVVVKHDDSGAGDGNVIISLVDAASERRSDQALRAEVAALPEWYLKDLAAGGVVEELLAGTEFTSPSVQIDVRPDGGVLVLSTHEQVLGGPAHQVFLGCRFPAAAWYAGEIAKHAAAIGSKLAAAGVVGRASIDFGAVRDEAGRWSTYALEVNLRKGGTTHPYTVLRNLVPGRYDVERGVWVTQGDGSQRAYSCTDNLHDPGWFGLPSRDVIEGVRAAGLEFDHRTGTGVVLHMLSGLSIDGRLGLTALDVEPAGADQMLTRVGEVVADVAASRPLAGVRGR